MPGAFLSYASADGELPAADLRQRLTCEAADIVIKQDRLLLEGGAGWWKQIAEAIDSVEFLILLMTPAAIASGNVQKEWRYARQQGVCVYPVKAAPDNELRFDKMPRWMSKAHFYDLEKEWPTFLAHLRKGCDTPRVPFMAPDPPPRFVQRPAEFEALKNLLLAPDRTQPVAIATALSGAGGFGKTTLAAALCHDEDILENFDDGILWVTLGQTPDVLGALVTAYAALTGERPGFASIEDAAFQLGQKLAERTCLLVVDDVWDRRRPAHAGRPPYSVNSVAVTPDGKRAVSASDDKTLKVWDLGDRPRPAHAGRPLRSCLWRGGDARREARGFHVRGQNSEGVGPGDRLAAAYHIPLRCDRELLRFRWRPADRRRRRRGPNAFSPARGAQSGRPAKIGLPRRGSSRRFLAPATLPRGARAPALLCCVETPRSRGRP
jgi:hypothetical protein